MNTENPVKPEEMRATSFELMYGDRVIAIVGPDARPGELEGLARMWSDHAATQTSPHLQGCIGGTVRAADKKFQTMIHALSEDGIVCFHAIDQPLVSELCAVIGALYRTAARLSAQGPGELEEMIKKELARQ